jgi:hypothetical protein
MPSSLRARPHASEYAPFFQGYISAVPEGDVVTLLREGGRELVGAVGGLSEHRAGFRYAEDKWTVREVIGHLIDAERIFSYRALRIARGDATPLPGFDENEYVRAAHSDERTIGDLTQEFAAVRESTVLLFQSLPEDAWVRRGISNGKEISVRALAYIADGHMRHHLRILRERYAVGR